MTIALIDTSVFCELLPVPHMASDHRGHLEMLEQKFDAAEVLLLPMATKPGTTSARMGTATSVVSPPLASSSR